MPESGCSQAGIGHTSNDTTINTFKVTFNIQYAQSYHTYPPTILIKFILSDFYMLPIVTGTNYKSTLQEIFITIYFDDLDT